MKRVVSNGPRLLLVLSSTGGLCLASTVGAPSALAQMAPSALGQKAPSGYVPPSPTALVQQAPAAFSQSFKLGPDDVLGLQVSNHPEMSAAELPVGANGKITLPMVGDLTVAGKSLAQAQKAIAQAYRSQLRAPQVTIALVRSRPHQVIALGSVFRAGPVEIGPGWRVSEVLAAAGGATIPLEDIAASLTHGKNPPIKLDLLQISTQPQSKANLPVFAGDVVNFPSVTMTHVTVNGDVVLPAMVTLRHVPHVLDAILAAGGLKAEPSDSRGTLIRNGQRTTLDIPALFQNSTSPANMVLHEGDFVAIETITTNISVVSFDNLVKAPGNYQMTGPPSVVRAVLTAGGLTTPADKVEVSIRRGASVLPVDFQQAVYNHDKDLPMREGDVLLVSHPEGPAVTMMGTFATPGVQHLKAGATLMDAIQASGGMTFKPEEVRLSVLRTQPGGKQVSLSIDPVALFSLRDLGQNLHLQDGDVVILNEDKHEQTVFVSGEVVTPGAIVANPNDGLAEVLLRAGGPTKLAALSHVNVTHTDGTTTVVDVAAAMQPNGDKAKYPILPGDVVSVSRNPNQVLVMNAVANPGHFAIPEHGTLTLGDALLLAGGARVDSNLAAVTIFRPDASGAMQQQVVPVNAVRDGKLLINTPLQSGDVVFVPSRRAKMSPFSQATQALTTLGLVARLATGF